LEEAEDAALPGGKMEGDVDDSTTALREVLEEKAWILSCSSCCQLRDFYSPGTNRNVFPLDLDLY